MDFINKSLIRQDAGQFPVSSSVAPTVASRTTTSVQNQPTNENPHGQFLSGNILQKGMDVLMSPLYGLAGFEKGAYGAKESQNTTGAVNTRSYSQNIFDRLKAGVSGILPGIQNRTQFGTEPGDVNAAKNIGITNSYGQAAYNFGLSLAAPSLPIGKVLGGIGKVAGATKSIPAVANVAEKLPALGTKITTVAKAAVESSPTATKLAEKIPGLEYFRNPEVGKIIKTAGENTGQRVSQLFNQINDVAQGLNPAERVKVGQLIEGGVTTGSNINLTQRANFVKNISDQIGKELVDLGVMSAESFNKYKGQYLAHIADVVKNGEMAKSSGGPLRVFLTSLMERKGKLGIPGAPDYIREFQFPTFKALAGEIQTAESTKALKQIAEKTGVAGQTFTKELGAQAGKTTEGLISLADVVPQKISHLFKDIAVPQAVADYVTRRYAKSDPSLLGSVADKALSFWKAGKTIATPAYHVRNLLSNQILADFATGAGLPATLAGYGRAVAAYLGHGSSQDMAYVQELKDLGVFNRTNIAKGVEELKPGVFGQGEGLAAKIVKSPARFQNASEETAKLNVYTWFREHGLDPQGAAKKAEEAIFSPYRINPTERAIVRQAIPFYSFTRQAAPFVAKTALNNPGAITKYEKAKTAIESLSPEGSGQKLPENMSGQIRTPIKDAQGNYTYVDPTYIYPWGNWDQGGGQGQLPLGLGINPLASEIGQQLFNKDLYFNQPIAKSNIPEKANAQRVEHAIRAAMPSLYTQIGVPATGLPEQRGGLYAAFTGVPDFAGRDRSKIQAILNAAGIRTSIFRPADQAKFDRLDFSSKLKNIGGEIRSIMSNPRIPAEDKTYLIKRLNEVRRQTIEGQ